MSEFHEEQALAFLGWLEKVGGSASERYERWATGKDFSPADRLAIRNIVQAELVARGQATYSDPYDYLTGGAA